MLAFRGEDHVERWCRATTIPKGYVLSLQQTWELGREWYADKLSPDWERAAPEQAEAVFTRLGLTGDFWQLARQG